MTAELNQDFEKELLEYEAQLADRTLNKLELNTNVNDLTVACEVEVSNDLTEDWLKFAK